MREQKMFRSAKNTTKRTEDVKKSAAKVLDTKKDTATRAKVMHSSDMGPEIAVLWFRNLESTGTGSGFRSTTN
jgi:hypothetical protein